jgi:hypothetical protein
VENLLSLEPQVTASLEALLTELCALAKSRRPAEWRAARLNLEDDAEIAERLRGLGYIE